MSSLSLLLIIMLYLDSLTDLERKRWVARVIANIMKLHGVSNRNDIDAIYGFPVGTTNTAISNGSYKRVLDLAITASMHFNVSLDAIVLDDHSNKELPNWKPLIANGVFKSLEAGVISVEYANIEVAADIILNEILSAETKGSLSGS